MKLAALVFDAYGTLFDVHSVIQRCESLWPGKGTALSQQWRAKQLEYSWLRSLMGRYTDFSHVTADALRHACAALNLPCSEAQLRLLMDEYRHLAAFPEAPAVLEQLQNHKCAILSNGAPDMLQAAVQHAGLGHLLDQVISVDPLRIYKPDPRVYQLAVDRLGIDARHIGFVSSNGWDAAGAKAFGFRVFWVNRNGLPVDELGVTPDHVIRQLTELPALL